MTFPITGLILNLIYKMQVKSSAFLIHIRHIFYTLYPVSAPAALYMKCSKDLKPCTCSEKILKRSL